MAAMKLTGIDWAVNKRNRLTAEQRRAIISAAKRAPAPIPRRTMLVPNRDVSFSTQLPFYVRVSVAAPALLDGGA